MTEKELTKEQKINLNILDKLKDIFRKKKIKRILIYSYGNKFWVSNPNKIIYYKKLINNSINYSFNKSIIPEMRILKVIYDDNTSKNKYK